MHCHVFAPPMRTSCIRASMQEQEHLATCTDPATCTNLATCTDLLVCMPCALWPHASMPHACAPTACMQAQAESQRNLAAALRDARLVGETMMRVSRVTATLMRVVEVLRNRECIA